ncbi:hypothetical protein L0B52_05605 [Suttonella sp. R2A3]|uniref:hypothetical protein n=1 Tax=Suttonella sp. R2A3 TaxID=2908648 RepID=UPI001F44777E|nr:hypothetical protein [Suttonella sp. R2A3]UJF23826.1 hypothetical protein L0B52_05605 [Suttonella sp. R2A3]
MNNLYRKVLAFIFSAIFHLISLLMIGLTLHSFMLSALSDDSGELIGLLIKAINSLVIALAMYELGVGVGKEYAGSDEGNIYQNIRRTVTRFVGTVCIALVLEGLIMIIKYSQLDMAGNLIFPVSIIIAASVLLLALGGFLALSRPSSQAGDSQPSE